MSLRKITLILILLVLPFGLLHAQPQHVFDLGISAASIVQSNEDKIAELQGQLSMLTILSLLSLLVGGASLAVIIRKER